MTKKEIISELNILKLSCEEGLNGIWDCSTDEGLEGFQAMINDIEALIKAIRKLKV